MAELAARGLVVDRSGLRALDGVDLDIAHGELVAIMGGTGAGKSTLALALCGLVELDAGAVGGEAAGLARLVLQRPESTLLAETVLEEVALAAIARGEPRAHAERRAVELLASLDLPADIAGRDPLALSGGEQRRVAIAAVLAADPRVLVLDEPGAGLDRAARHVLHDVLRRLHAAGRTIVLITHDPDEAASLATRLVVLRDGRVVWDGGTPPVLGDPARAASLGLATSPEIEVLHAVAAARGTTPPAGIVRAVDAVHALGDLLAAHPERTTQPAPSDAAAPNGAAAPHANPTPPVRRATAHDVHATGATGALQPLPPLPPLPRLVDARVRVLACAVTVAAALLAQSLLAAALVTVATGVVVALARIARARVRLAVRPLLALLVLLVALQLLLGGEHEVAVAPGIDTTHPAAAPLLRALQAAAVVLATLALSATTAIGDMATALRHGLAPLRLLRVPVGSIAFVVATGLGLVPAFADELERLRLAQRARGIRRGDARLVERLRADATLVAPLFVAAFRRAHLLADALAVRGVDPDVNPPDWRPRRTPARDTVVLVVAVALVVMTRLA
ncbi:MAG: transporter related protein [Thermoleophilia bacterium]|nr:transporter related protein [Thermoleophilia bacterium]